MRLSQMICPTNDVSKKVKSREKHSSLWELVGGCIRIEEGYGSTPALTHSSPRPPSRCCGATKGRQPGVRASISTF